MSRQNTYKVEINVYVRAKRKENIPSQCTVENKISSLLLAMPREDEEGYCGWDVSGTSLPPDREE